MLTKSWLGVFPVVFEPGAFELQATVQTAAGLIDSTALAIQGDFAEAPQAASLPDEAQSDFLGTLSSQELGEGFGVQALFELLHDATVSAKAKLLEIQSRRSSISIGDMFEMQMLMNHLSQLEESTTQVVSVVNDAIQSMARNVKG